MIDLKVTVQEGTKFSNDSGVSKLRNYTPASLMASTGESCKRPFSFKKTSLLIKKIS